MLLSVATWNVNSVKSRLSHLLEWLKTDAPSIVLLQELKCIDDAFPAMEIEAMGYNIAVHGQKTYNGVAILSKFPLEDVRKGLPDNESDGQARYIEAVVNLPGTVMRVASVYVPNGQSADSEKFQYKLGFLGHLLAHAKTLASYDEMLVIGGDYNIAPEDADVHNPKAWEGSVLTHDEVRRQFRRLCNAGLFDAFRLKHSREETGNTYSWWDYRAASFARDDGLRIDHLMVSSQAADKVESCAIVRKLRALEKASDHAPVIAELNL